MDGGTLMNQCIHNIDLLRWMMGNEVEMRLWHILTA